MKAPKTKKMKPITYLIKFLQEIKKNGGGIDTVELSNGMRRMHPGDKEFSFKDDELGWIQRIPDGTFSITITGFRSKHESNTRFKKRTGKKER